MLAEDNRHGFSPRSPGLRYALTEMDAWLTSLTGDGSARTLAEKVVDSKPAGLRDACWSRDAEPRKIVQLLSYDNTGECGELYPAYPTPRLAAGAPLTDDVVKCRRKPVEPGDYAVAFREEELSELRRIFPDGVCDWSREGYWQEPPAGTWQAVR